MTTTQPRVKVRQRKTRIRLLRAAHQLMAKQGVDATTIQQITEAADVGFGTFYNYFASKDDLAAQVLDCVIHNLGQRNDLVTQTKHLEDPVLIVATSVRLVARELMRNPMWQWWVKRPDLVVGRMRAGFRPFGIRDMRLAMDAGEFHIVGDDDMDTAWSFLIWLLAGGVKDIIDGYRPAAIESLIVDAVMRIMGVSRERAEQVTRVPLPPYPPLDIDFSFVLEPESAEAAA